MFAATSTDTVVNGAAVGEEAEVPRRSNSHVTAVINCHLPLLTPFTQHTMIHLSIIANKKILTIKLFKGTTASEDTPLPLFSQSLC